MGHQTRSRFPEYCLSRLLLRRPSRHRKHSNFCKNGEMALAGGSAVSKLQTWNRRSPPRILEHCSKSRAQCGIEKDWETVSSRRIHFYWWASISLSEIGLIVWFQGALLYVLRKRTIEDKARAIYNLRTNIRAEYKDIRNNSTVGKSLWGHINNLEASPTHALFREQNDAVRGKKKRKVDVDEEEDEYRPEPMRNFGKTPKTRSKQARMG